MERPPDYRTFSSKSYHRRIGFSFHPMVRIVSIIMAFLLIGFAFIVPILGLPLWVALVYSAFSSYGIQIQNERNRFREYSGFLWMKWGKWFILDDYPDVAILKESEGFTTHSLSDRTTTDTHTQYGVYFLPPDHRKRILAGKFKHRDEAQSFADRLAFDLSKNFTTYNPKISSRSRRRR